MEVKLKTDQHFQWLHDSILFYSSILLFIFYLQPFELSRNKKVATFVWTENDNGKFGHLLKLQPLQSALAESQQIGQLLLLQNKWVWLWMWSLRTVSYGGSPDWPCFQCYVAKEEMYHRHQWLLTESCCCGLSGGIFDRANYSSQLIFHPTNTRKSSRDL